MDACKRKEPLGEGSCNEKTPCLPETGRSLLEWWAILGLNQ